MIEEKILQILALGHRVTDKKLLTKDEKRLLIDTYKQVTGIKKKEGCGACFIDIFFYFKTQQKMKTTNTEFEIIPGKRVYHRSNVLIGKVPTNTALSMLKDNPKSIQFFASFPSDWKERAEKFNILDEVNKPVVDEPVKETDLGQEDAKTLAEKAKREALESKTLEELQEFAKELKYKKTEWQKIEDVKEFVDYLIEKSE